MRWPSPLHPRRTAKGVSTSAEVEQGAALATCNLLKKVDENFKKINQYSFLKFFGVRRKKKRLSIVFSTT